MSSLVNKTRNSILASEVERADTTLRRMVGLIGRNTLPNGHGLWIVGSSLLPANSIHTFFMQFSIDLVFLDKNMRVKSLVANVKPWRLLAPVFGATSVVELPAGTIQTVNVAEGDQLDVVS